MTSRWAGHARNLTPDGISFDRGPRAGGCQAAWASHRGRVRSDNHDRAALGRRFAMVADGVGSTAGGGMAAAFVVRELSPRWTRARTAAEIESSVWSVQHRLLRLIGSRRLPAGSATTLVGACRVGSELVTVSVGDSVIWQTQEGDPPQRLNRAQATWDPFRQGYVLTAALGMDPLPQIQVSSLPSTPGTRIVLASDGILRPPATDQDLLEETGRAFSPDPLAACLGLVRRTLASPARDNVTVAVVDL